MTVTLKRWQLAVVAAVLVVAGVIAYDAATESCDEWHARFQTALSRSIFHLDEPGTLTLIEAQRPEGC
jgi:hypothetical protein